MQIDLSAIRNPAVRNFYMLYWQQHQIIRDFYERLDEANYDYRMTDTPESKSDSPRESLAHILYVQLVYLDGVKSGVLEYKSMGTEHYAQLPKAQLLQELERIDRALYDTLTAETYDSNRTMKVFWGGEMNAVDVLYFLRDHDILHIGWNLALMDNFNMPRFQSLVNYWG